MKPGRRHLEKANTPKDLVDQFRELLKLRIKVSKAELAVAQKKAVEADTRVEEKRRGKSINRGRVH
jgi:hypothetical protein